MREIKFRAWHNNAKRYMEDLCLYLDSGELGDVSECFHNLENKEDYVLEQYTGLTDKNSKEIYEGDIVKVSVSHKDEVPLITPVVYDNRFAEFKLAAANSLSFYLERFEEFEIIGNIHENPELL